VTAYDIKALIRHVRSVLLYFHFLFRILIISHLDYHTLLDDYHIPTKTKPKRRSQSTLHKPTKMPSSNFQTTFPIILILLLALMLVTMPTNAQNPIANSYFCRMRCDASFNACVNQMGKPFPLIPFTSSSLSHHHHRFFAIVHPLHHIMAVDR
jgi:hypothetical protein